MKKEEIANNDERIIRDVLAGNVASYEAIMRKYNQRLYRIGKGFFKNNDLEIEDIMQFTYIKAYEKLTTFQFRASFGTWLIRIFINEAIRRLNYNKRFNDIVLEDKDEEQSIINKNLINMNTPFTNTINNELKTLLEEALNKLPEKYRTVFIMREIEKMNIHDTGKALKLTESNIKVRLNRAKKMLKDELSKFYQNEEVYNFNLVRCDVVVKNVFEVINKNKISTN